MIEGPMERGKFENLKVSKSQMNHHLRNNTLITIKKPTFDPKAGNSENNLQTRYEWFMKWKDSDLDYTKNCISIDEAGFYINMRNSWTGSAVGTPAQLSGGKEQRAGDIIIKELTIEYDDVERRTAVENNKPVVKGTTTVHFVKFMNELLDIMDMDESLMGSYLVMDNCTIHKSHPMIRKIESRGYRVMYLPPYSPELNPIEQFWALVKGKMKHHRLMIEENLSQRIAKARNNVRFSDLEEICGYSKRQIINCYNKTNF
ncbi:hypothetical protein G6F29_009202 [Rhizopus arrhizus]|uniref:Tc1-like transposase DDE domain-containing protein n=1 Tax=Rhizopus oryzae TaxID=64495 RepID=A0A9P7BP65_RHIOR|nr:hypothetical protein G6F19_008856 [Rhizopus arrhizus]KAG0852041.1 hypothetical protein G6F17_008463 [Rhizopus arrhizus]KAG0867196.1 hypothetical protein G6F16_008942 [Rhizopus arrhizus]KAG0893482.1 hypothetical protein G6F34_009947 [Rhizopus arrhizus]KAG0936023.1 hypothetical protein G6F30_009027 [Rhizopus arrhizus]